MRLVDLLLEQNLDKIIQELDFYTASPMHEMSPELKQYLNTIPKPEGNMRLWRVVFDSPEQFRVGEKRTLRLPKESSWTKSQSGVRYLLNQAEDFGYDTAVVFETTVNGNNVLVDLEMLPIEVKNQVNIDWPQKEVILDLKQVPVIVVNVINN